MAWHPTQSIQLSDRTAKPSSAASPRLLRDLFGAPPTPEATLNMRAAAARSARVAPVSPPRPARAIIDLTSSPESTPSPPRKAAKRLLSPMAPALGRTRARMSVSEDELDSDASLPDDDPFAMINVRAKSQPLESRTVPGHARARSQPLGARPALVQPSRTPTSVPRPVPSGSRGLSMAATPSHAPIASTSKAPSVASSIASSSKASSATTKPDKPTPRERRKQYKATVVERDAQLGRLYPTFHLDSTSAWPKPVVVYTDDPDVGVAELAKLKGPLAFDMEWKPSTRVGQENPTSILQFADTRRCLVFHLLSRKFIPRAMIAVLEDPSRIKMGVNIRGDAQKLVRDFGKAALVHQVRPSGLLELSKLASVVDPERFAGRKLISLQWLVGAFLSFHLPKTDGARQSDWSKPLNSKQQAYAAADVWCTIQLYRRLLALADIADRQVDVQALLSDVTQPATPAPSTVSTTSGSLPSPPLPPTARQTQAYDLVYGDNCLPRDGDALPIDAVARQMGIQPSSVVSYLIDGRFRTPPTDVSIAELLALLDSRGDPFLIARYRKRLLDAL